MARFLVQTIPNKLPELLINLSSQGPHLMGATLSTLLRAVAGGWRVRKCHFRGFKHLRAVKIFPLARATTCGPRPKTKEGTFFLQKEGGFGAFSVS